MVKMVPVASANPIMFDPQRRAASLEMKATVKHVIAHLSR
jgi:hypothetical protein